MVQVMRFVTEKAEKVLGKGHEMLNIFQNI